ncbi:MAG: hypothetical protein P4L40_18530 [Terracidiphilus sp.]|nr:hypothetical protein [Terracidiphilus sp.]
MFLPFVCSGGSACVCVYFHASDLPLPSWRDAFANYGVLWWLGYSHEAAVQAIVAHPFSPEAQREYAEQLRAAGV